MQPNIVWTSTLDGKYVLTITRIDDYLGEPVAAETPACSQCKLRGYDIPKRSWPSQEMADVVRLSLQDSLMVTYACPVQPGYFHIGHAKA
jgi:hypothetical protein